MAAVSKQTTSSMSSSGPPTPSSSSLSDPSSASKSTAMTAFPAASSSAESTGLSQDAKIGIGIGVPLGLAMLVAVGLLLYRDRKNKKRFEGQGTATGYRMTEGEYRSPLKQGYYMTDSVCEAPTRDHQSEQVIEMQIKRPIFEWLNTMTYDKIEVRLTLARVLKSQNMQALCMCACEIVDSLATCGKEDVLLIAQSISYRDFAEILNAHTSSNIVLSTLQSSTMDARALLTSQGWRGSGHSLHPTDDSTGLSRPILVSQKRNVLGVGKKQHRTSDMWWMNAFDKSLQGLDTSKEGEVVQTVTSGGLDMVTKGGSRFVGSGGLYACFVRGEGLTGTIESREGNEQGGQEVKRMRLEKGKGESKEERRARKAAKRAQKQLDLKAAAFSTPPSAKSDVDAEPGEIEETKEQRKERRRRKRLLREAREKETI
ncbi:MAG: hypothetical protein M1818_001969 [Claussenomyces sp. TS43310]|nr:MAG: hypothetical protein M1818_001969 [Claussenomyces sp. TS43310]